MVNALNLESFDVWEKAVAENGKPASLQARSAWKREKKVGWITKQIAWLVIEIGGIILR